MNENRNHHQPTSGRGLAWVFLVASIFGLGLSLFISQNSKQIREIYTPLIREKLPILEDLGQLEKAILSMQINHYQYFSYSINHRLYQEMIDKNSKIFSQSIKQLKSTLPQEDIFRMIQESYDNSHKLIPKLEELLNKNPIDWDEARAVLVEMSIDTQHINRELALIRTAIDQSVYEAGLLTEEQITKMVHLVSFYIILIFLIAILVAYHINARTRAEEKLTYNAYHDITTRQLNRRALEEDIENLGKQASHVLTIVSVDRFHRLIASLGHEMADKTMIAVANQLNHNTKLLEPQIYRLDGANFGLLYSSFKGTMRSDIELILETVKRPVTVEQYELLLTVTCGSARFPNDGEDALNLIRNANLALEHAKKTGTRFIGYASTLNAQSKERLTLESALSHAAEKGEFELFYQPQMSLKTSKIIGVEALIRWRQNGRLIPPMEFIPIAEESGLIVPIGEWVLKKACQQALAWEALGLTKLTVAVNLSARQFQDPRFLERTTMTLNETNTPSSMIELEITESVMMHDPDAAVRQLCSLKEMGFALAIDDFGTGYSSLAYLKKFPINKIKIDKSFIDPIQDPHSFQDISIVEGIIQMGHSLNLQVIAEGVETEAHLQKLRELKCDEVQGYYLSKPMPADQTTAYLLSHAQAAGI